MNKLWVAGLLFLLVMPFVMADSCPVPESLITNRPTEAATRVDIGVLMIDINDIDDVKQTYTVDALIRLRWIDERLIPYADNIGGCTAAEIWTPKLTALNRRQIDMIYEEIEVSPEGIVTMSGRHYGTLNVHLDMREFPFDTNPLQIILTSASYEADEMYFVVDHKLISRMDKFTITDFDLGQPKAVASARLLREHGEERPVFEYSIEAERKSGFFMGKLFLPLLLIVFMSWTVFWIDSKKMFASQLSISALSMLNIIAYLFAFTALMPRLDYLTKADVMFIGSAVLVLCSLLQSVLTTALVARGRDKIARRIDLAARWVFPSAYVLLIIFTFVL
ncbi:hypothetical protein GOV07_03585 [Candidatus Woesearchaeota archaeon]|nr:hypothetical protein [Candidatus Woesearchaeota archaeon]